MNWLAVSVSDTNWTLVVLGMIVWFISMGLHEGGHALMAHRAGDYTIKTNGKLTANPFRHIEWNQPFSVILGVVMPLITMIMWGFPSGMAWVMVRPDLFRNGARDHAIVSVAGPAADMLLAVLAFAVMLAMYPVFRDNPDSRALVLLWQFLFLMYFVSLVYAVVSMIPIPPLDGSRVLYWMGNWRLRQFMDTIAPYGWFIYIGLFFVLGAGRLLQPIYEWFMELYIRMPKLIWGA